MSHLDRIPTEPHSNGSPGSAPATRPANEARSSARVLVAGAGLLIAIALAPIAVGLASSIALYQICAQPYERLTRRLGSRAAAALTVFGVVVFVVGPLFWVGHHLSARLPSVLAALGSAQPHPDKPIEAAMTQIGASTARGASTAAAWLQRQLLSVGRSVAWTLTNWSIALLVLYYFLVSPPNSWHRFARLLPFSPRGVQTLRVRLQDTTRGIVAGTLLSAAAQGGAIGIGFALAGVRDALFWGVCAALAALVPVVGNKLVWVPGLLVMLVEGRYEGVIIIAICGALLPRPIGRVVRATVTRRAGGLHPLITMFGALGGIRVAGMAGVILGPVALGMFFTLLDVYSEECLAVERDTTLGMRAHERPHGRREARLDTRSE